MENGLELDPAQLGGTPHGSHWINWPGREYNVQPVRVKELSSGELNSEANL